MSGHVACFYGGIRLRDNVVGFWPTEQTTTEGFGSGLLRAYGSLNPDSPNVRIDVEVACELAPVAARSDLSRIAATEIDLAYLGRNLHRLAADGLQFLSYCPDDAKVGAVTGGSYAAGVRTITHGALGGSWTTAAGRYVLLRNPTTGEGFVSAISARTAGDVTVTVPTGYSVTSSWYLVDVCLAYPSTQFLRMSKGSPPSGDPAAGFWRPDVRYYLVGVAEPLVASAHEPTPP
jgi:hypothetical protein